MHKVHKERIIEKREKNNNELHKLRELKKEKDFTAKTQRRREGKTRVLLRMNVKKPIIID